MSVRDCHSVTLPKLFKLIYSYYHKQVESTKQPSSNDIFLIFFCRMMSAIEDQ